jgi:hypothetical protein
VTHSGAGTLPSSLGGQDRVGLVALDVHPRVAMTILRHSKIAVTMDIYS